MNLFNLYEPKEPKTLVPLVSSKKYTILLSILKRMWIVPHDYIKEAWSFEVSKDPTDHPTARTWSCGSLNRKLRWAVPILHPWELRGNEWELCSASVIVWFIKEWQKTWRDIFKWKPKLTPPGLQHITLHPKAERDTAMQNSSTLKMATMISRPCQ